MNWRRRFLSNVTAPTRDDPACAAALERIVAHPASALPPRRPTTGDLDDGERRALQAHEDALGELEALITDLETVSRARYEPAVSVLARLFLTCPAPTVAMCAGHALRAISTDAAHDTLQARLGDSEREVADLAVSSLLADPRAGYRACAQLADRALAGDPLATRVLVDVLYRFTNALSLKRSEPLPLRSELEREPRWLDLAAGLRRGRCEHSACAFLDEFPAGVVAELFARHPLPPARAPRTELHLLSDPANPHLSDHALWDRLVELGPVDGELRASALQVAMRMLQPVARNADRITARLGALGWPLQEQARRRADAPSPAVPNPFTGEVPTDRLASDERARGDVDAQVALMERTVGARLPVALEAFWRVAGQIVWAPASDAPLPEWAHDVEVERIDPLCVEGIEVAWHAVGEWVSQRASCKHPELAGPPRVWIAPDRFHKMGISGGASYEVELDGTVDPHVLNAPEGLRLMPYLRHAIRWGGLAGLARCERLTPRVASVLANLTHGLEPVAH